MRAARSLLVLLVMVPGPAGAADLLGREDLASASRAAAAEPIRLAGVLEAGAGGEIGSSSELALNLVRFDGLAPGARLIVHDALGEQSLPLPPTRYWTGAVEGRPGSRVTLAVRADGEVRGILADEEGFASLRARPEDDALAFVRVPAGASRPPFECAADELPGIETAIAAWEAEAPAAMGIEATEAITHTARVAVETDYEYFQLFGDSTAAAQYALDLLAFSSTIYVDEVETNLLVVSVSIWTSAADPWVQSSTSCSLYEFGKYWNDNHAGDVRTIAHFLSGKPNGGGVAWIGVLCSGAFSYDISAASCPGMASISNYGGAYGYTGTIDGDFQPGNPQPIWDTIAVTHEIGHNFSSPHTHCYANYGGSSSHVDQCWTSSSSGCYASGRQDAARPRQRHRRDRRGRQRHDHELLPPALGWLSEHRSDDGAGPSLRRAARPRAAAHGRPRRRARELQSLLPRTRGPRRDLRGRLRVGRARILVGRPLSAPAPYLSPINGASLRAKSAASTRRPAAPGYRSRARPEQ